MRAAPVIEPAVPELHAHPRLPRPERLEGLEGRPAAAAEVHRRQHVRKGSALQHPLLGAVRGEEGDVDAAGEEPVAQMREIVLVGAEGAVLVLHLDHDDVAAPGGLPLRDDRDETVEPGVDAGEPLRIRAPDPGALAMGHPRGQSPVVPLRADVRAGTHDGVEVLAGCEVEELRQLVEPLDDALRAFVQVPRHVGLDGVQAHRPQHPELSLPLPRVDPEVVQRAREDPVFDAVPQKAAAVDDESAHTCFLLRNPASRGRRSTGTHPFR